MSAISIGPITVATSKWSPSRKLQKPVISLANSLDIRGDFDCRKYKSCATRGNNLIIVKDSDNSIRGSMRDENIEVFEQEVFVDGSFKIGAGGLEATLNSLSKWFVAALLASIILWRHDAEAIWAAMGAALNNILSLALKKILNQERPISTLRSDPGMPSSHAQNIFFAVAFLNLTMVEWYGMNALTSTLSGFFVILGSYFSWLRVSQRLHTVVQIIVGAVIGSIFSVFWFWSWDAFVLDYFVSSLWVRAVVILGAVGFCVGIVGNVLGLWLRDE